MQCTNPLIYTQAPTCEACCSGGSTSTDTHDEGEDEVDKLDLEDFEGIDEETAEEDEVDRSERCTKPKAKRNLVPNAITHRASFQCLSELATESATFDPFGTNAFKLELVS